MDSIVIFIGKKAIKLGDSLESAKRFNNNQYTEITGQNKIESIHIPIAGYSHIYYKGKKYKDMNTLMHENGITTNSTIFFCGEGEDIIPLDSSKIDLSYCPFGCKSIDECFDTCMHVDIHRGEGTIGCDIAQIEYPHGSECILLASPNKAYNMEES